MEIMNRMGTDNQPSVSPVITKEELLRARSMVDQIYVDKKLQNYIVDLVMATREPAEYGRWAVRRFDSSRWFTAGDDQSGSSR